MVTNSVYTTSDSYYIDDPVTGDKVRVTDASGSSFDYLGATRKEDLFYYDDMDGSYANA